MPINYQIAANVVDIRTDNPFKGENFFVDTNVWYWMTYTRASSSALPYQITDYPNYVNSVLDAGGKIYQNGLSFAELAHLIEKTEFDIFNKIHRAERIKSKEFRHNHSLEREKVIAEIEAAWGQVKSMAEPLEITIDESTTEAARKHIKTNLLDGYDLFILQLLTRHNVLQIITDDGDFATIPGIKMFTSNKNVIKTAQKQKKIMKR